MGHYILDNAVIYTEQGKIENGYIEIQDGYHVPGRVLLPLKGM